jgi:predicted Zn-dependent peptidase
MNEKRRISASVDADVFAKAELAVANGFASSVSAWVNNAMVNQIAHEQRMAALDRYLEAYEAEFGEITPDDIVAATRRTRANSIVVRGSKSASNSKRKSA